MVEISRNSDESAADDGHHYLMPDVRSELDDLKRISKLDSFRAASLPSLAAAARIVVGDNVDSSRSIELLIDQAIDQLSEGPHRTAAEKLVGFGPSR